MEKRNRISLDSIAEGMLNLHIWKYICLFVNFFQQRCKKDVSKSAITATESTISVEKIHSVGMINNVETSYFTQLKMCYLMEFTIADQYLSKCS